MFKSCSRDPYEDFNFVGKFHESFQVIGFMINKKDSIFFGQKIREN